MSTAVASPRELGVISALYRYPVKSMQGERCDTLPLDLRGAVGDRAFAVVDAEGRPGSGKNTRRFCRMDGLIELAAASDGERVWITFPDGRRMADDDPDMDAELSRALGRPVTLLRETTVSHLDAGALHLLSSYSLRKLQRELPAARIGVERFRPNVVLEFHDDADAALLQGACALLFGGVALRIAEATERCRMVCFAQPGYPEDPSVLRHLARTNEACFGVYADAVPGLTLRVGDSVLLPE